MRPSTLLTAAALWASSAKAIPAATPVVRDLPNGIALEKRADETAVWIEVDDEGQPAKTHSPSLTVEDGTTRVHDGAPHDLTASVFTFTDYGEIFTSEGPPPNPTATAKGGQGAFARCHNMDGEHAPFCDPIANSTLLTDKTYYITWDPDFFNTTHDNTTWEVSVRLDWLNHTDETLQHIKDFDRVPATWGFWPLKVETSYLKGFHSNNVTLTLLSNVYGSAEKHNSTRLWLNFSKKGLAPKHDVDLPQGEALTIALPTVFGFVALVLVGGFLWNRKTRRISLGNVMSRSRHGYTGRKQRRKDQGIQLDTRGSGPGDYRDAPERSRRDSDGLGSLANSPVDANFQQQGTLGGRNAFRDEIRRQELERQ